MSMANDLPQDLRLIIQRLSRRVRFERTEDEITDGQRSVLFHLFGDGAQTLSELSARDRVSPPSMSRTVNALVGLGLVTRVASSTDARKVSIDLTSAGRALVQETRRKRDAWFSARIAKLTPEQKAVLAEAAPILRELAER
jgi:DNA-binding MarR family transcriptional regulator